MNLSFLTEKIFPRVWWISTTCLSSAYVIADTNFMRMVGLNHLSPSLFPSFSLPLFLCFSPFTPPPSLSLPLSLFLSYTHRQLPRRKSKDQAGYKHHRKFLFSQKKSAHSLWNFRSQYWSENLLNFLVQNILCCEIVILLTDLIRIVWRPFSLPWENSWILMKSIFQKEF